MKKFIRIGIVSLALITMSLFNGVTTSALSWHDLFSGGSSAVTPQQSVIANSTEEEYPCLQITNHEYEVCTAYAANSAAAVLVPYYKYANSTDAWSRYVTYRLGSRYSGQAYEDIRSRVASWPAGKNEVEVPRIHIVSVNSDLTTNSATLVTQETWSVEAPDGTILYSESNREHAITMARVPSYVLHKWVVTSIR
jgi:hypothetical protein